MDTTDLTTAPQEDERADFPGLKTRYLLRGEDTGGGFALLEHRIPPRTLAAPTHTHRNEDEYSFVLSGRMGAHVGDTEVEAGPGELVRKPRGVPHAFWNAGDEEAVLLELISPAGFEQYFADLAPHLNVEGPPNFERLGRVQAQYELSMDLASIGPLAERHGLER